MAFRYPGPNQGREYLPSRLAREMGDASQAVLMSLFQYDFHERRCGSIVYAARSAVDLAAMLAEQVELEEMESKGTRLVEGPPV